MLAPPARNMVLLSYTAFLIQGGTLNCRLVKVDTIKSYLKEAAAIVTVSGAPDPRFSDTSSPAYQQSYLPRFRDLLREQQRLEQMPNRREPVDRAILSHIRTQAQLYSENSKDAALRDWAVLGESTGFRVGEFASPTSDSFVNERIRRQGVISIEPRPFIVTDFEFFDEQGIRLHTVTEKNAAKITICWRVQKNGVNGQKISFGRSQCEWLCPVRAGVRIIKRFHRINPRHKVLAIHDEGLLTHSQVTQGIRMAASHVYKLNSQQAQLYSAHSIRVGACVLLHEHGFNGSFIKVRLRWKSDTFLLYLRNTDRLTAQHAAALTSDASYG